jgi:hypothetical protein
VFQIEFEKYSCSKKLLLITLIYIIQLGFKNLICARSIGVILLAKYAGFPSQRPGFKSRRAHLIFFYHDKPFLNRKSEMICFASC